ncbi:MAG: hypothetical protein DMF72_14650 [Acidobacteria bacterium]|nr:MAG: hypothetical protein DMF72_14650 [Acidobacteriota bacterium]
MNIRKSFPVAIIICAVVLIAAAQTKNAPRRIVFARGATVARSTGYMRGIRSEVWFVLRLSAGQHIRVEVGGSGSTRGVVIWPSGKQDGGPGGVIYDGEVDETGDYKIAVGESLMGEAWRGPLTVTVEALPRGQASPDPSDLGKYAGKYPSEMFRDVPAIRTRLRRLLGVNYKAFTDRMQVEVPFEKDGDVLVTRGCMAHSCTIEEAILAIDLNDASVYVALKMNSKISRTFPANRSQLPEALKRAMAQ